MLAYVVARARSRWATVAFLVVIAGLLIPSQVILLPAIQVLRASNLMFTMPGLLLANASQYLAFATFVYVGFIRRVPRELDESARVDGAGPFTTYRRIVMPLLRPATASLVVILSLWAWNDFLNPLLILGPNAGYTITSGIYRALGQYTTDWEQVFAFLWLSSIPLLVLYVVSQRHFISGLAEGGVKG
jgi:raffinose/stachyose/melibiose transport system permease protein